MGLFDWFKTRPQPSSNYKLASRIASAIDTFIDTEGAAKFDSDQLCLVVHSDYRISISGRRQMENILVSVPLKELGLNSFSVHAGAPIRHMAVDNAALLVMRRLEKHLHPN
jgi:hypothetical protein